MGGFGSSRWNLIPTKKAVEGTYAVDIRLLSRKAGIARGVSGEFVWRIHGKPAGRCYFRLDSDQIELVFESDQGIRSSLQTVKIENTPCTYGGVRHWLICPACGKRACILYHVAGSFLCRKCGNLSYHSQQECPRDRMLRKARKIRLRLGGGMNMFERFPEKPKRMRWKTYGRLEAVSEQANLGSLQIVAKAFGICGH